MKKRIALSLIAVTLLAACHDNEDPGNCTVIKDTIVCVGEGVAK